MIGYLLSLAVTSLLLHVSISTTYFVIPDHYYSMHYYNISNNTFTLRHYLNNTSKYFLTKNQLHFLPGWYYLDSDLVFNGLSDFVLSGHGINQSFITCSSPAGIMVTNADIFTLQNITLIDCITPSKVDLTATYLISVFLYHCGTIKLYNIYINISASIPAGHTAIHVRNVAKSRIIDVKVQLNIIICYRYSFTMNGLAVYYSGNGKRDIYYRRQPLVIVENFSYHSQRSCSKYSQCAIAALLVHITDFFHFIIQNTVFSNLSNTSAFCYYGIADEESTKEDATMRSVLIKNVTVCYNTGYNQVKMFQFILYSFESYNNTLYSESNNNLYINGPVRLYNMLEFENCYFIANTNIDSMIYVRPSTYSNIVGYITISNSKFNDNKDVRFIKVTRESQNIPNVITHVSLASVTVSHNRHHYNSSNLILITNGRLYFSNIVFTANHYYETVIHLQSSVISFKESNQITKGYARYIIKGESGSFLFIHYLATVNISNNVVYKALKLVSTEENLATPTCPLQIYDDKQNNQFDNLNGIKCIFLLLNNTEMISKSLSGDIISFVNKKCDWLEGTHFKKTNSSDVYRKIIKFNSVYINATSERFVPLSVCPCLQNSSYNCYIANLGSVFPGQTLHIQLIISQQWSKISSTITVANTKDDDCSIVNNDQLLQSPFISHGCNNYSYTIWPSHRFIRDCKLFIGLSEMPEMFYVQIKPCPVGFTLQDSKKSCYCDPILSNSTLPITSCNLDDETIQRPANSWISAETENNSFTYKMSPQCPFDYCLPHFSNLNLSNPDSQCQFKRSGVVCGECQQSLSTTFGSSDCKHCSNFYLLLIIPIAIAGVVLVMMLFTFNLTVTNGIINTLIFYVNIISINYSLFCYDSHSPDCTILSLLNLDLGIETCFYDGMNGYTKTWLQLAFPFYLMIIAFTLIVGSRHSSKLQRLTANRVLKVLATLFLLSYTKILITVCQVLFYYSSITHLPSEYTTSVWSIDTGVVLFGVKFCILFSVCIILFLILLMFNAVLLFPRMISRWSFVNRFKPLLDAYFGPYKQEYPFWTGLQLLIRSIFLGLSALSRSVSLCSGAVVVGAMLCAHGMLHPFKSRFKNFQESLVLLDLLAAYVTALYSASSTMLIVRILIITVLAYFIALIFCHCMMLRYGDTIKRITSRIKQVLTKKTFMRSLHMEELSSKIPDVAFNYKEFRDSLVALD